MAGASNASDLKMAASLHAKDPEKRLFQRKNLDLHDDDDAMYDDDDDDSRRRSQRDERIDRDRGSLFQSKAHQEGL